MACVKSVSTNSVKIWCEGESVELTEKPHSQVAAVRAENRAKEVTMGRKEIILDAYIWKLKLRLNEVGMKVFCCCLVEGLGLSNLKLDDLAYVHGVIMAGVS